MLNICIIMRDNLKVHMIYIYRSDQTFIFLLAHCLDKVAQRHITSDAVYFMKTNSGFVSLYYLNGYMIILKCTTQPQHYRFVETALFHRLKLGLVF